MVPLAPLLARKRVACSSMGAGVPKGVQEPSRAQAGVSTAGQFPSGGPPLEETSGVREPRRCVVLLLRSHLVGEPQHPAQLCPKPASEQAFLRSLRARREDVGKTGLTSSKSGP